MVRKLTEILMRWRTWVVNTLFVVIISPELLVSLAGYNWGAVLPPEYLPYVMLANILLNVWMRPRPAVLARDLEAREREDG